MPLLDAVPPIRRRVGRPRRKPRVLVADRGYDFDKCRRLLRARGIRPMIARRGVVHGSGLGRWRWMVERTLAWLHRYGGCGSGGNVALTSMRASSSWPCV
jgi:IS5 family transposase